MEFKPTYKTFGRQAILIEWEANINVDVLKDIVFFKEKIITKKEDVITDLIVGYNSLTIKYKKEFRDFSREVEVLKSIYKTIGKTTSQHNFIWEIPVCYDAKFGIDLKELSSKSNLSIQEIIKLHSERIYTVFFIGFLPGFLYLGGLNEKLFFDRKSNPRLNVDKGSIAIGGEQTGIYPSNSPGGWNILGKTPIDFFNIKNKRPCFANPGDKIKFKSISFKEFSEIEKEVANNNYVISKTQLHD